MTEANSIYHLLRSLTLTKILKERKFDSPNSLLECVCRFAELNKDEIKENTKNSKAVSYRRATQYLLVSNQGLVYEKIGEIFKEDNLKKIERAYKTVEENMALYRDKISKMEGDLRVSLNTLEKKLGSAKNGK